MPSLPRPLMNALRTLMEATTVDPNAAGMLYPVSPRGRAAARAQELFEGGADQDAVWRETGLTLSPDLDNTGVWLGARSWADARLTDDLSGGDFDSFVTGAPLPQRMRNRMQIIPEDEPGSQISFFDDDSAVISLGNKFANEPGGYIPPALAHEAQHMVGADFAGVPRGTNLEAARASRIVQDAFETKMPGIKQLMDEAEEAYWRNPTPAAKREWDDIRAVYDYALTNPEAIRDQAAFRVYSDELGEGLGRWAEKNAHRSLADIRSGPAPFADLDIPLARALVRGESLSRKYRDRSNNADVKRLANFFQIATALGGLGLSMGAVREALEREMEREAA